MKTPTLLGGLTICGGLLTGCTHPQTPAGATGNAASRAAPAPASNTQNTPAAGSSMGTMTPVKTGTASPTATSRGSSSTPAPSQPATADDHADGESVYAFTLSDIDGKPAPLSAWRGKPLLLVNVASQCGYTPQYAGLEALHEKYASRGLVVVGVPSNDFGGQEPGSAAEIKDFCTSKFGVKFPMMSKVAVSGAKADPLYGFLATQPAPLGGAPKWNFTKFVTDRHGRVIARFDSKVTPDDPRLAAAIEKSLAE
ncbi:hypothetical protein BH11PLA1_BH11PLA1_09290 [soil metagenome]